MAGLTGARAFSRIHWSHPMRPPFQRLKARYLLVWLVVASVCAVVISGPPLVPASSAEPFAEGLLMWTLYGILFLLTVGHARRAGLRPGTLFDGAATQKEVWRLTLLSIPLVGVALASTYALFAPLALVWPDAVHAWLLDDIPVIYDPGPPFPLMGNILGVTGAAIAAPVVEEWYFRGLLLRRWTTKWGVTSGVIGSSLVFAVLHVDVVGAFVFGVAMCALFARYRSLWPAVVVHVANNVLVVLFVVVDAHSDLVVQATTVEQFRTAWWMLPVGMAMAAPWLGWLRSAWTPVASWRFESDAERAIMQQPG